MDARFTVLASGSSGNSSLLEASGFGLLIDCGLPPRTLTHRLAAIGSSWNSIHAVVLTHTHCDHWKDTTLAKLRSLRIPIYANQAHLDDLNTLAPSFESLHSAKLTRSYRDGEEIAMGPGISCRPIRVPHDAEPTFAFRIGGAGWSLGYASDLGHVPAGLADALAGVDLLAVEFNHDVHMQRTSGRPAHLIQRVLGNAGHLSNAQAGEFTRDVIARSGEDHAPVIVQLHLSRQCNTPPLAVTAAKAATVGRAVTIVTARQDMPTRTIPLDARARATVAPAMATPLARAQHQPTLPGFGV